MSDPSVVRYVAELARLALGDAEIEPMAEQLASILGYVERLGGGAGAPAIAPENRFRPAGLRVELTPEARLQNAAESEAGAFSVPKVL